jgi:hypothetical protein
MKNQNALRLLVMLRNKAIDNNNKENKKIFSLLCIEKECEFCHRLGNGRKGVVVIILLSLFLLPQH